MAALNARNLPWPAAIAVSGGGDSLALMLLLSHWAKDQKLDPPTVLSVDHGLQKNSAASARKALQWAKAAGLEAHVLVWKGARPKSDIEAAARDARYRLMGDWCVSHKISALYLAHNLEDQAETFLIRLARGSSVDGLAAMRPIAPYPVSGFASLMLVRPLLGHPRDELRGYLKSRKQAWLEDPMNTDPRFTRTRIRALWPELEKAGLSASRIAAAAGHLARVRATLDQMSDALLTRYCRIEKDHALLHREAFALAPPELALRTLSAVLMRISGANYRPRFERLKSLYAAIAGEQLGAGRTLHGCRIGPAPKRQAVFGPATLLVRPEHLRRKGGLENPLGKRGTR